MGKMSYFIRGLPILLILINQYHSADVPSVVTKLGSITGETKSVTFQGNEYQVDRYLGIPYAKPPTGDLRFQPPQPFGPFSETYNAIDFGASCPQPSYPFLPVERKTDEDCLFLNIYVPRQKPDEPSGHAIMFFIHGGGFSIGSSNIFDGAVLSSEGNVIVVTINYRLGLLGFLDIDNEKASGNFGLLDQHLALQWVNANIGAFGGDKDRVTIFGESAGSMSVAMQMLYPSNKGLFRNGITQSGALGLPGIYLENNINTAKFFAENMSCNIETVDEVFNCLKEASHENIIQVILDTMQSGGMSSAAIVGVTPTIDGKFIRKNPANMIKKADTDSCEEIDFFRSIKLINGVNGNEGGLFLIMLGNSETLEDLEITREQMNTQVVPGTMAMMYGNKPVPELLKQLIISEYTDWENPDDPKRLREQLVELFGDIYCNVPCIEMSRFHSNASNVDSYVYHFLPKVEKPLLPLPKWVKYANHGDEVGPVFGYNFDPQVLFNISEYTPPAWELDLSRRMMKYWTNFAKTGDPNKPDSEMLAWPKYDVNSQSYFVFDREDSIGQYLYARATEFWTKIVPAVIDATEHAQTVTEQFGKKDEQTCDKDGNCG
ncbi:acetylcholinesterase-like [Ruditapes philippinarum]|uniref:acetylcholinesterase-like n=1 Tax=Ruditapes philippinarum TaxID=129788 RepID=UPI00295C0984|nr:acetylcholinesterase-like [Ruditapes philippinarum]